MQVPLTNLRVSFLSKRFLYKAETLPHPLTAVTSNLRTDHGRTALACELFGLNPVKVIAYCSLCMICPLVLRLGWFMFCWKAGVAVKFAADGQRREAAVGFHGASEVLYMG